MSLYRRTITICEVLKSQKPSQVKIIRGCNYLKYRLVSAIENLLIRVIPLNVSNQWHIDNKEIIIASLTTFPLRINECYYAIKSIMLQSIRPNKIVLWLAESQFPEHILPSSFDELIKNGLSVRYCDDLRSHKKYFYALQEQKEGEVIITFDDDIIYHPKTIERALNKHRQYPSSIVANSVYTISVDKEKNEVRPYTTWQHPEDFCSVPSLNKYSVLTGSGCLYPFGALCKDAFDKQKIRNLAFTADDLWITFMAMLSKTTVVQTDIAAKPFTTIKNSQKEHLALINSIGTGNDDTVRRLLEYYPQLKKELFCCEVEKEKC